MPKVTINHESSLPANEAFSQIKVFFETDPDIRRLDPNLKCQFTPSDMKGKASGTQFQASIEVLTLGPGSVIKVDVELPLLLAPFKGKVQDTIKKKLSQYLA